MRYLANNTILCFSLMTAIGCIPSVQAKEVKEGRLKAYKEYMLAAVRQDGSALCYADESLKADREVVLAAVRQDRDALQYAHSSIRDDKDIIEAYSSH